MTQYGFFFDQSRCTGCRDCSVACKNWHQLPPGPLKYLKVYEYEKGSFPQVRIHFQWIPCYRCEEPACMSVCPVNAIRKEPKYGAVLIDSEKCTGCRICYDGLFRQSHFNVLLPSYKHRDESIGVIIGITY